MSKKKISRPKPRLPGGFKDENAENLQLRARLVKIIGDVYSQFGFSEMETPIFEYSEAIGQFLPDDDRPNAGVFSLADDDGQWLSLRYDLTAPLARYVAENFEAIPKPFRSYRCGYLFRNEKPGLGRFRQFMQFDADTVGSANLGSDAEMCMMAAEALEHIGFERGQYMIRLGNRKILDGVMQEIGLSGDDHNGQRLTVLRSIDKLDKLGFDGVDALLGEGRKDASGDFTKGARLEKSQRDVILNLLRFDVQNGELVKAGKVNLPDELQRLCDNEQFTQGIEELVQICQLAENAGYSRERIAIDLTIVRGLAYYTGPVFEAVLTASQPGVNNEREQAPIGAVGGGGRYDDLVSRFRGVNVPATGFSMGISRLCAALQRLPAQISGPVGPVIVTVLDQERFSDYQEMAMQLRRAGINAEVYLGGSGIKGQMKYADRRHAPCVVIQGSDELANKSVQIKNLALGRLLSATIDDNQTWRAERPAQSSVAAGDMVAAVKAIIEDMDRS